jgi:hypothetical protein
MRSAETLVTTARCHDRGGYRLRIPSSLSQDFQLHSVVTADCVVCRLVFTITTILHVTVSKKMLIHNFKHDSTYIPQGHDFL